MAEAVKMRIEHSAIIVLEVTESQFSKLVADKVPPIVEVGATCACHNTHSDRLFD